MNEKRTPNQRPQAGLTLSDIYYVLFRHKWTIIVLSSLGFIAAGVIYIKRPTAYTSGATVMIKYVRDNGNVPNDQDGQTVQVSGGPDGLIYSEMEILSSFDLALRVATNVGPAKILAKYGGGDNMIAAAGMVHDNLAVERVAKSGVLKITLTHRDSDMVGTILKEVINAYQARHTEIHTMNAAFEQLQRETDDIHNQLLEVEGRLQAKQAMAHVVDVDSARKTAEEVSAQIHFQIISAKAELEQHKALLAKLKGSAKPVTVSTTPETNAPVEEPIPQDKLARYSRNKDLLDRLKNEYLDLRTRYKEESTLVKEKQAQIDAAQKTKEQMEKEEPRLVKEKPITLASGQTVANPGPDATLPEEAQVVALESKIKVFQAQAAEMNGDITNIDAIASDIRDLQRTHRILDDKYISFQTRLQTEKLESDMQALKGANIYAIENPTPPAQERSKTPKLMGMAAAAGVLGGLAWAFLMELYIDHTVKRPKEIESDLGMRLFVSIPDFSRNGHRRKTIAASKDAGSVENGANGNGNGNGKLEVAPWDARHSLHQYSEALRDRLISYFDVNNLNHKPKLVAVTGAGKGVGTSTIAAGLAASLSETGDGNVLLVDMNMEQGSAQQFHKGQPGCELDAALEQGTRENALIQEKLYLVSGSSNGDQLSRMLPKRFANLVPKLKASDYDYIIFDMPPIARTGVTQRLAGFMDMMLLVVEAEKSSREVVRQAGAALSESKANVSVVLNKTRTYIPARLHQEF